MKQRVEEAVASQKFGSVFRFVLIVGLGFSPILVKASDKVQSARKQYYDSLSNPKATNSQKSEQAKEFRQVRQRELSRMRSELIATTFAKVRNEMSTHHKKIEATKASGGAQPTPLLPVQEPKRAVIDTSRKSVREGVVLDKDKQPSVLDFTGTVPGGDGEPELKKE
jgi:hypothetical protein